MKKLVQEGATHLDEPEAEPSLSALARDVLELHAGDESADALSVYLRGVRRSKLFSAEEEYACAMLVKAGDFAARPHPAPAAAWRAVAAAAIRSRQLEN